MAKNDLKELWDENLNELTDCEKEIALKIALTLSESGLSCRKCAALLKSLAGKIENSALDQRFLLC